MGSERHYANPYIGKEDSLVQNEPEFQERIRESGVRWLAVLESKLLIERDREDSSVYTGSTGIALMYWRLATLSADAEKGDEYRNTALILIETALPSLRLSRMSFLGGDAGTLALAIVLYDKLGHTDLKRKLLEKLVTYGEETIKSEDPSAANEILYGRAGYLFSLLFINANCPEPLIDSNLIAKMANYIVMEGQRSRREYLYYEWHDKCYFGAAHGILGIVYILLKSQSLTSVGLALVRKTIDWMLTQRFPSGNTPSSLNSQNDSLIHWCHGAPGAIYVFIEAHKVFKDERYLNAARNSAGVIWDKGFLRKGYGLCHGVAGNAYGLMAIYTYTKEAKYLKQAYLMAEWCFDYGTKANRTPDRPLSLFEGLAGVVYMLSDFGSSSAPKFPAFEL